MSERDFLLLDGDCGLCHRLATFMDKRLASGQDIGYRPILSDEGQTMIRKLPKKQQDSDSVYLIRNGKSYIRSAAGIRCLLYMKWYYKMWFPIFWIIPLPIRDIGYRIIAKYRHKFFTRPTECLFRIDQVVASNKGLTIFEEIRPVYGSKKSSNSKPSKNLVNKQTQSDEPMSQGLGSKVWLC